jgi:2-polyprenyl-3-methyl-5-hydroxy-6-metoxy-1,4-benzoquinol methylase
MDAAIHTTMDRSDLLTDEAQPVVRELDTVVRAMYARGVYPSSWYGSVPPPRLSRERLREMIGRALGRGLPDYWRVGLELRDEQYAPLRGTADDGRFPWYHYWQITWAVLRGPALAPRMIVLDAGGSSSLLSCLIASRGITVHATDINPRLVRNARRIARVMGWPMHAHLMPIERMDFPPAFFDHAYAIGLFHHLSDRQRAESLDELHRCLKSSARLSATFDYRNPAPYQWEQHAFVDGRGFQSEDDIRSVFTAHGQFILDGDARFVDRGVSPFVHTERPVRYTFAGIVLAKTGV